ncbi:hypothetical protein X798_08139 [Onchocerca flexuosa]|uniref:Peptidase S1 domain-containing protein n=1 Tax=Onchocerca flexuosa TaxID=387005 RepID=A0A238BI17_9BILA|nr:hypothetical protein X798_08139 [Onchocerca flexuosa]
MFSLWLLIAGLLFSFQDCKCEKFGKISKDDNLAIMDKCQSLYKHSNRTIKFNENTDQFKLLGGQIVSSADYGYMVQIIHIRGISDRGQDINVCSGVIITFRHIITAASCLDFNENGLKKTSVSEFKIYGGSTCLYINLTNENHDNVLRFACPTEDENTLKVASIKPIALLVPMSSVINNVASIRGVPFYEAFSDIAIFEVEPIDKLAETLNEKNKDLVEAQVNFDVACISEPTIRNEGAGYIIASYGRNLFKDHGKNPINVKLNVILENNVYIDECPASIPMQACARIMIIEGEQTATEGDGGAAVMKEMDDLSVLMGILSYRPDIGRAYASFQAKVFVPIIELDYRQILQRILIDS